MTEQTIRRKLREEGYFLKKGRDAYGCVGYMIYDLNNVIVSSENYEMSLEDVEKWLED